MSDTVELIDLLKSVRECRLCEESLPLGPRPVLVVGSQATILLVGQAPGTTVHASGIPWDDASGDRLRHWMGVDRQQFYDAEHVAMVPMGFCYPGRGKSGDLPPRPECAESWHSAVLAQLKNIRLTVYIGLYAQSYYLGEHAQPTLTETVRQWNRLPHDVLPLPHPSPRNNIWLRKNPWFEAEVIPELRSRVKTCLEGVPVGV
jgi:uracil-DNA glycosylase